MSTAPKHVYSKGDDILERADALLDALKSSGDDCIVYPATAQELRERLDALSEALGGVGEQAHQILELYQAIGTVAGFRQAKEFKTTVDAYVDSMKQQFESYAITIGKSDH